MKKNFFKKKLASGLALALVVASLSPAGISASAATSTHVVKQGGASAPTVLYVGGAKVDYSLSKVYKSNSYTWTVSDSSVATITAKTGVVTAKAPGTVTIKATARNSKGVWLAAFTQKLTIKLRATSVDAGSDDFTLVMGEEKDLNAVKTPSNSTDAVRYYSSDETVATVDAKTGVVKTVGVGEATITVYSKATWASATASKYNKTDEVKVTVVDGIQSIKQTTTTKFEVVFGSDQSEKLKAADLTITDSNGVKQIVKSLSFSDDGKTATAELYISLTDKETYKVVYGDSEKTFVASIGDVASIVVSGKTVQYATATGFDVKLYDANGVDVTTDTLLNNNVTFDYDASEAYVDSFNSTDKYKITVFTFPKAVTLTATYHTYDYVDGVETTFKSVAVINSVEEIKDTAASIKYTLDKSSADWTAVKTTIPAGDSGYMLFLDAEDQDGNDLDETDFDYESTDIDVLTVVDNGSTVYVYPGKQGTAYIKATYGGTVQLLAVTVGAASKVASVVADTNTVTLYSSLAGDTATVTLTGKDQYGTEVSYAGEAMTIDHVSGDSDAVVNASNTPGSNELTFTLNGATVDSTTDGTNTYKITFLDKTVIVYVKVIDVTDTTVSYINIDRSAATVDAKLTSGNSSTGKDVTFTVYGYNANGQKVQVMNGATIAIKFNGVDVNSSSDTDATYVDGGNGVATFAALDVTNAVVTQAAVGTYTVEASSTINSVVKKAATSFSVTNTQDVPTVSRTTTKVGSATTLAAVQAGFDAKINGTTVADSQIVAANVVVGATSNPASVTAGDTVYVKSITVRQPIANGKSVDTVVNVGLSLIVE